MSESSPSASYFPPQSPSYILSFQFSSWYPSSSAHTLKSTIIRPLSQQFHDYLNADGVFVPEGSEDLPAESTLSDDEDGDNGDEDDDKAVPRFAFPDLDAKIRTCIKEYGAVFPKLNFSSPKDASWILPASSPLKCTSPADVYLLLKSSDFAAHDLSPSSVFDGCDCASSDSDAPAPPYELELVLRKWYAVDKSRELRCFVRENVLLGISQRDTNYYPFLNDPTTQTTITTTVTEFWQTNIKPTWESTKDYTLDILLTRDLSRAHILDFNPYARRTDPLLFTYHELHSLLLSRRASIPTPDPPQFKVIDSCTHPTANSNAPANQHNMVPFEALSLSSGRDIQEFADLWREGIKDSMEDSDD